MSWRSLWDKICVALNQVANYSAEPEHNAASLGEKSAVKNLQEIDEASVFELPQVAMAPGPEATEWNKICYAVDEMMARPFETPLPEIPSRRYPLLDANGNILIHGVYSIYGRPPKETTNRKYPKARLRIYDGLPGHWNDGSHRLYVEESMGIHLRQALRCAEDLEERLQQLLGKSYPVLSAIDKMGSYNHRPIRHKEGNEYSYHSWAIAADLNPARNRGISKHHIWQKRGTRTVNGKKQSAWLPCQPHQADRGPIDTVLPFSAQWYAIYPDSLPYELIVCFQSVGFAWGGDWGRSAWHAVVRKFGTRYHQENIAVSQSKEFETAAKEWSTIDFTDPMHVELVMRGQWAQRLWARNEERLKRNLHS